MGNICIYISSNKYWKYCEIYIPNNIILVPSIDRVNIRSIYGEESKLEVKCKPYTIKEYQNKFSIKKFDGLLYWK